MWAISERYAQNGNPEKANEIIKLNNPYRNIWREIPENVDEENEA